MHPNDARLSNVYTRELSTEISDRSFAVANSFEIVLEAEAGSTVFNDGVSYHAHAVLHDLTANENISIGSAMAGSMGKKGGPWEEQATEFVYIVAADHLRGRVDHICQVVAFLRVGSGREPNVSFASSPLFLLHE
jgi:hypothetical protein